MEDLAKLLTKFTMDLVKNLNNTTKKIESLEKENSELKARIYNIEQVIYQINKPITITY